jgi:hypothetical protein
LLLLTAIIDKPEYHCHFRHQIKSFDRSRRPESKMMKCR